MEETSLWFQETPSPSSHMNTAMLKTPGTDSLMFQTPGRPDSAAYSGPVHTGKRTGGVTFQFPESSERTFRQGMGTNMSLSTWGSDFSPTGYTTFGSKSSIQSPTPGQVRHDNRPVNSCLLGDLAFEWQRGCSRLWSDTDLTDKTVTKAGRSVLKQGHQPDNCKMIYSLFILFYN